MKSEFEISIDNLYSTFSKYPFKSTIEGCPCCVSDTDKSTLHSKQLKELEDEDISRYAFKAMTTWGNLDDFKHYLPRILELTAKRKLIVDTFVILGKLDFGKWKEWENDEQQTILEFLRSWWKFEINHNSYFDAEVFIELYKLIGDLQLMLDQWNLDTETPGFKNFLDLIENHYHELKGKTQTFKEFRKDDVEIVVNWIETNGYKLEDGFFKLEGDDKQFGERISNTLYILERIK